MLNCFVRIVCFIGCCVYWITWLRCCLFLSDQSMYRYPPYSYIFHCHNNFGTNDSQRNSSIQSCDTRNFKSIWVLVFYIGINMRNQFFIPKMLLSRYISLAMFVFYDILELFTDFANRLCWTIEYFFIAIYLNKKRLLTATRKTGFIS